MIFETMFDIIVLSFETVSCLSSEFMFLFDLLSILAIEYVVLIRRWLNELLIGGLLCLGLEVFFVIELAGLDEVGKHSN